MRSLRLATPASLVMLMMASLLLNGCQASLETPPVVMGNTGTDDARIFQEKNISNFGLAGTKKVALTYDDGPTPGVTPALLELLRKENLKAVFFMNGAHVPGHEDLLRRMREDGHIVANHTETHDQLSKTYYRSHPKELVSQIESTHEKIAPYMSPSHRMYFRAPYGAWLASHAAVLNANATLRQYIGPIFWNAGGEVTYRDGELIGAADWDCWGKKIAVQACASGYLREIDRKGGGVVLMHDKFMKTVQMTELLIPWLRDRGYQFITLDDVNWPPAMLAQ